MALKRNKGKNKPVVNEPKDADTDFDIAPPILDNPTPLKPPVGGMLTPDKVAAVRFQQARPGYAYPQVEAFVEQVKENLLFFEAREHTNQITIRELEERVNDAQESNLILQSTIEVFKANGDPIKNADGTYMTASQAGTTDATVISGLQRELAATRAELAAAHAEIEQAWSAEETLRSYLENDLMPVVQAYAAKIEAYESSGVEAALSTVNIEDMALATPEYKEKAEEANQPISDKKEDGNLTAPLFAKVDTSEDDSSQDWDDAPSIEEVMPKLSGSAPLPTIPHSEPRRRRKEILLQSPEVAELESAHETINIPDSTIEEPIEETPRPNLLANAPEVVSPHQYIEDDPEFEPREVDEPYIP